MPDTTIDGDTKIRLANLVTTVSAAITITAILVGLRGDVNSLTKAMGSVVAELAEHNKQIQSNTHGINELRWQTRTK